MCGIAGIFYFDQKKTVDTNLLNNMTDILVHRGPDDSGIYVAGNVGLGFRRLSIIDLSSTGHQPMCNENESVWLVFNGEIYNYKELRSSLTQKGHVFKSQSDTEVIIHLYEEYGVECLDKLDGMFAFSIWDKKKRQMFLARDRFGIKPLYYYYNSNKFLFGSEIKAILTDNSVEKQLNYLAVSQYLSLMQVPTPNSIYRQIYKLPASHAMTIKDGRVNVWKYWDIVFTENEDRGESYYIDGLRERFSAAIKSHLVSDVPVGTFLSGGIDSSAIVAYASQYQKHLKTFNVSFFQDSKYDESYYATKVAQIFDCEHHQFNADNNILDCIKDLLWFFDEPFAVSSAVPLYHVTKLAREKVKVVLSGDGADEQLAGYEKRYLRENKLAPLDLIPCRTRHILSTLISRLLPGDETLRDSIGARIKHRASLYEQDELDRYAGIFNFFTNQQKSKVLHPDIWEMVRNDNSYTEDWKQNESYKSLKDRTNQKLYFDINTSLVDEMLTKVDRVTMSLGLEARVPFLDRQLAEFIAKIPKKYKLDTQGTGKWILRKMLSDKIPDDILFTSKRGFDVPMHDWMKKDFKKIFYEFYDKSEDNIFSEEYINKMLNTHKTHNKFGHHLWIILVFIIWFKTIFHGDFPMSRSL